MPLVATFGCMAPGVTLANERREYSTRTVNYLHVTEARTVRSGTLTVAHLRMRPKGHRLLASPNTKCVQDQEGKDSDMAQQGFSRRYFFYGSLLAGAIPRGGFGS